MSVKHEPGRRWVEMVVDLDATPEQVWQAVATGPGCACWFVPARIEERAGGAMAFDFGQGAESPATVTAWQAPRRFAYEERDWKPDAPPVATEITIEALAGGTCRMRMTHTIFTDRDDWDGDMGSWETGWPGFFRVLRRYLAVAPGATGRMRWLGADFRGSMDEGFARLQEALGLKDGAAPGTRAALDAALPGLSGTLASLDTEPKGRSAVIHLDAPVPGTAEFGAHTYNGPTRLALLLHLWGEGADAAARKAEGEAQALLDRVAAG